MPNKLDFVLQRLNEMTPNEVCKAFKDALDASGITDYSTDGKFSFSALPPEGAPLLAVCDDVDMILEENLITGRYTAEVLDEAVELSVVHYAKGRFTLEDSITYPANALDAA